MDNDEEGNGKKGSRKQALRGSADVLSGSDPRYCGEEDPVDQIILFEKMQ